jgi:DNA-binding LacI/PurR family transcriptional regulator
VVTLATLAERLGVSRTTVSNAYNRPDQLSPKLRSECSTRRKSWGSHGPNP